MMRIYVRYLPFLFLSVWLLSGCSNMPNHVAAFHAGYVKVHRGETLRAIAWRFDINYRKLASWNGLSPPYKVRAGQWIRMNPPASGKSRPSRSPHSPSTSGTARPYRAERPVRASSMNSHQAHQKNQIPQQSHLTWSWPTKGSLLSHYSKSSQGIEIGGKSGQPILAAASGQVVYSGNGLPSYGNLIIIKHNDHYLSAYAHNKKLLVKEGAMVKRGQKIALMGETGTGISRAMLFFEIRVNGHPVNPIPYLKHKTH